MEFWLRALGWIALHLLLTVVGAAIGGFLIPKVNPHNDWGATGLAYMGAGGLIGSSLAIVVMLWWTEQSKGD